MNKWIIILSFLIAISLVAWWYGAMSYRTPADQVFAIAKGESANSIISRMQQEHLIRSSLWFKYYTWRDGSGSRFKAGQFLVPKGSNMEAVALALWDGRAISEEQEIKLIEGWNIRDMAGYLSGKSEKFSDFQEIASGRLSDWRDQFPSGLLDDAPVKADLEGYLFPDTYRLFKESGSRDAIMKMIRTLDQKLTPQMRQDIRRQGKTIYEILTMASIVQKEVRSEKDMKIVSGIFWSRIRNSIRLESCASLAYITGENKSQFSYEDTQIDSPYNTYRNDGLPPGPIANPGLAAIEAAIYPEDTPYLYFLSDPATGETIYSRNFEEHKRNKARYLK